jgi:hypothetical protein
MDGFTYDQALARRERVTTEDGDIEVASTSYARASYPVSLRTGPMAMSLKIEEALALAGALIEVAHHWQGGLDAAQRRQAEQLSPAAGGDA